MNQPFSKGQIIYDRNGRSFQVVMHLGDYVKVRATGLNTFRLMHVRDLSARRPDPPTGENHETL